MSLADSIETKIRAENKTRFGALNLPDEFIAPNYSGRSIVNLSASITKILGGKINTPSLDADILGQFPNGVRRIVYIIADAVGYGRMLNALDANPRNGFHALLKTGGRLVPITSVFPSTTTAALSAIWSGSTPAEHGFVGFQLFLREYGARANMIAFNPVATEKFGAQQLVDAGLVPEKFLAVPSLPQTLARVDVPVYNLIEQPYVKSALSRVQIRGTKQTYGFVTSSDMWVTLRYAMEQHLDERALFVAYWSAVDGISHSYGPSSETVVAEIDNLAFSFEREFLSQLSREARHGTLFLLSADHGQLDTPASQAVYLRKHPKLRNRLIMDYAGEPRAAYLYCRNGEIDAVRDYVNTRLADQFIVLDSTAALNAGLLGTGKVAAEVKYRIGDLILLPRENFYLWDRRDEPRLRGRHGGLAEKEMLVPLLIARLDG